MPHWIAPAHIDYIMPKTKGGARRPEAIGRTRPLQRHPRRAARPQHEGKRYAAFLERSSPAAMRDSFPKQACRLSPTRGKPGATCAREGRNASCP